MAIVIAAAVATATAPTQAAVTNYTAAFFASSQPTTALDMILLAPGFTFNCGDQVRGFGGASFGDMACSSRWKSGPGKG